MIFTSRESFAGTQKLLPSSGSGFGPSKMPGFTQLNCESSLRQFSKCPISSEKATLYVCADHVLPRVLAVSYSGWNAYGASWHDEDFGVYRMWPNPFATDAVMDPVLPVVRSAMSTRNPATVSCMWIRITSPGFIRRSLA